MNNNGVGFLLSNFQPCLIYKGDAAPWSGLYSKMRESHRQKYSEWSYVSRVHEPSTTILLEGLIRWEDE